VEWWVQTSRETEQRDPVYYIDHHDEPHDFVSIENVLEIRISS
jgi:hypothetical protein